MIKVFDTTNDFETYSAGGLKSGELCYVAENKTAHFRTNNIDGADQTYNMSEGGGIVPEGNIDLIENGVHDVSSYATASVNVAGGDNADFIDLIERDITTLNIPSEITKIGNGAFSQCSGLTSITIPDSVTSIGSNAFQDCYELKSITIPDSVTSIGNLAFCYCINLASITVLATTPPTLGTNVFVGNAGGRKIYVPAESVEAYKAASGWSNYAADIEAIPPATAKWSNTHNSGNITDKEVNNNESVLAVKVGGQPVTCTFDGEPSTGWTITQNGLGDSSASVTLNGLDITVDPSMAYETSGVKKLTVSRDGDSSYSAGKSYFRLTVLSDDADTNFFWNAKSQNIKVGNYKFVRLFNYYPSTNIQFTSSDPDNITVQGSYDKNGYYGATITSINEAHYVTITATLYDTDNVNVLTTATMEINPY